MRTSRAIIDLQFDPSEPITATIDESCSWGYASVAWIRICNGHGETWGNGHGCGDCEEEPTEASGHAAAWDIGQLSASAGANASVPSASSWEICTSVTLGACGAPCNGGRVWPFGAQYGRAKVHYAITGGPRNSVPVVATVSLPRTPVNDPTTGRKIHYFKVVQTCGSSANANVVWATGTPNGQVASGLAYDPINDEWSANVPMELCGGANEFDSELASMSEDGLDVDGSGRFCSADVAALSALLDSTDEDDLAWDFDRNGVIDQADVDFLQSLIDAGLSAGTFGDVDGNGSVDRCDWALVVGATGATMGGPGYFVELDDDLDGTISASEFEAMWVLSGRADWNRDHVVNSNDLSAFQATWLADIAHSTSFADFNGDGVTNSNDLSAFQTAWLVALETACN